MNMNFKDFLDFFKLPPHTLFALALGTGLVLFLPDSIISKLYLLNFRNNCGWVISLIFIISFTLLVTIIVVKIGKKLYDKILYRKLKKKRIKYLKELDKVKTQTIKEFLKEEDQTLTLNYNNGVTQQLLHMYVIQMAGNTQPTYVELDNSMPIAYFLQPWVSKIIDEDQYLKTKFYGKKDK